MGWWRRPQTAPRWAAAAGARCVRRRRQGGCALEGEGLGCLSVRQRPQLLSLPPPLPLPPPHPMPQSQLPQLVPAGGAAGGGGEGGRYGGVFIGDVRLSGELI